MRPHSHVHAHMREHTHRFKNNATGDRLCSGLPTIVHTKLWFDPQLEEREEREGEKAREEEERKAGWLF